MGISGWICGPLAIASSLMLLAKPVRAAPLQAVAVTGQEAPGSASARYGGTGNPGIFVTDTADLVMRVGIDGQDAIVHDDGETSSVLIASTDSGLETTTGLTAFAFEVVVSRDGWALARIDDDLYRFRVTDPGDVALVVRTGDPAPMGLWPSIPQSHLLRPTTQGAFAFQGADGGGSGLFFVDAAGDASAVIRQGEELVALPGSTANNLYLSAQHLGETPYFSVTGVSADLLPVAQLLTHDGTSTEALLVSEVEGEGNLSGIEAYPLAAAPDGTVAFVGGVYREVRGLPGVYNSRLAIYELQPGGSLTLLAESAPEVDFLDGHLGPPVNMAYGPSGDLYVQTSIVDDSLAPQYEVIARSSGGAFEQIFDSRVELPDGGVPISVTFQIGPDEIIHLMAVTPEGSGVWDYIDGTWTPIAIPGDLIPTALGDLPITLAALPNLGLANDRHATAIRTCVYFEAVEPDLGPVDGVACSDGPEDPGDPGELDLAATPQWRDGSFPYVPPLRPFALKKVEAFTDGLVVTNADAFFELELQSAETLSAYSLDGRFEPVTQDLSYVEVGPMGEEYPAPHCATLDLPGMVDDFECSAAAEVPGGDPRVFRVRPTLTDAQRTQPLVSYALYANANATASATPLEEADVLPDPLEIAVVDFSVAIDVLEPSLTVSNTGPGAGQAVVYFTGSFGTFGAFERCESWDFGDGGPTRVGERCVTRVLNPGDSVTVVSDTPPAALGLAIDTVMGAHLAIAAVVPLLGTYDLDLTNNVVHLASSPDGELETKGAGCGECDIDPRAPRALPLLVVFGVLCGRRRRA